MKKTIKILLETDTYQLARHLTYMDCKVITFIVNHFILIISQKSDS